MQPQHRLRARADFERARRRGRSWGSPLLGLTAVRNDLELTRCGFVVSRRVGKAVVRNRVRRRLREVVRRQLPYVAAGWDLVFSARPAAAQATSHDLRRAVSDLLARGRLSP
jgi:ribonuclease P protein component